MSGFSPSGPGGSVLLKVGCCSGEVRAQVAAHHKGEARMPGVVILGAHMTRGRVPYNRKAWLMRKQGTPFLGMMRVARDLSLLASQGSGFI